MNQIAGHSVEWVDGYPVGVVRFAEEMEVLSSAVFHGGAATASAAFIMQVPHDFCDDDPVGRCDAVRRALGLPEDTVGMMTASDVEYVFNLKEVEFGGVRVAAFATAGLSNHVIAGEELLNYEERAVVSARRSAALRSGPPDPGTINTCVVSPLPLNMEGKVGILVPMVEAKAAAMRERGFVETGTTSDAVAVFCPHGDERVQWTGTGTPVGIAAARASAAAIGWALDRRDEHPIPFTPMEVLGKMGLDGRSLHRMSGSSVGEAEFLSRLDELTSRPDVAAALDLAWCVADRVDSVAEDGGTALMDAALDALSRVLGTEPPEEGSLMDCAVVMLARKAGGR